VIGTDNLHWTGTSSIFHTRRTKNMTLIVNFWIEIDYCFLFLLFQWKKIFLAYLTHSMRLIFFHRTILKLHHSYKLNVFRWVIIRHFKNVFFFVALKKITNLYKYWYQKKKKYIYIYIYISSLIIISHHLFYINLCFRTYLKNGETVFF
jgi:hypothetical protein